MNTNGQLFLLGVAVHAVLLLAIFDIYYKSPLLSGLPTHRAAGVAPADRLVLFVADGLRYQSFGSAFTNGSRRAPFLWSLIDAGSAAWGVSQTHVPTESRPGHVAMAAGFYEDVSAVATGWKANPVTFDSVFNQSRLTYAWGSPDIVPMFANGVADGHVKCESYSSSWEDFASDTAWMLDTWVFDKLQEFLRRASNSEWLENELRGGGLIFFLHLLGMDTSGHGFKPHSAQYLHNLNVVDSGVAASSRAVERHFGDDGRTAFLFTADHGMTDWGSHGAGHAHETHTPFVLWGAGVAPRVAASRLRQVDLAPLMAALLGRPLPVNSMGRLPHALLALDPAARLAVVRANVEQLLEMFTKLRRDKKTHSFRFLFREFDKLDADKLERLRGDVGSLERSSQFERAVSLLDEHVSVVLEGIDYFHRYERPFLGLLIAATFLSWNFLLVAFVWPSPSRAHVRLLPGWPSVALSAAVACLLFLQSLPLTNYVYAILPILLVGMSDGRFIFIRLRLLLALSAFGAVLSVTFFWRPWLSVVLLATAVCYHFRLPSVSYTRPWLICSCALSVFPVLPTSVQFVCPTITVATLICVIVAYRYAGAAQLYSVTVAALLTLCLPLIVLFHWHLLAGAPILADLCHCVSWLILLASLVLPFVVTPAGSPDRLVHWAICLFAPYSLMSVSYECLFYVLFAAALHVWCRLESVQREQASSAAAELRRTAMVSLLVLLGFFGTGKLASLNSFDPSQLACFVSVFRPFVMTALLVGKALVPVFLVALCLHQLRLADARFNPRRLLNATLVLADALSLVFFFLLKDTGSWLDIGTSIGHYVISMSLGAFLSILFEISRFCVTTGLKPTGNSRPYISKSG